MRRPGTCPACLLGGSQLPGRVEVKPQGHSSQRQMPGTLFAHTRRDNLSHHPPRQASCKKTTKPRFSDKAGMLHAVSTSERHLPEEKGFSGNEGGRKHRNPFNHEVKRRTESALLPQKAPSFLFVAMSGHPSHKGFLSYFPRASKPGQVWHEWDGGFRGHTYLTETCVEASCGKCQ